MGRGVQKLQTKSGQDISFHRTLFISDTHLGTRNAQAAKLIDFLSINHFSKIYIVGDFIDVWRLQRSKYWPQKHTDLIRKILKRSKYSEIIYITGNHDEFCLNFLGFLGNIKICEDDIHLTAKNEKILVLHGHQFDNVTKYAKWISKFGDMGYEFLLSTNSLINFFRRIFKLKHWSLSAYVKSKVKDAVNFMSNFEHAVSKYALKYNVDSVLCGHIHTPAIKKIDEINYYNCGDWVESCTALIEENDGQIKLFKYDENNLVNQTKN